MFRWSRVVSLAFTAVLAIGLLAACVPGKVTGGGWIASAEEGGGKAHFSYSANFKCEGGLAECDEEDLSFRANGVYHDKAAGVNFKFDGAFGLAEGDDEIALYGAIISYTSIDKRNPGSGYGCMFVFDGGQRHKMDTADAIFIYLGNDFEGETPCSLYDGEGSEGPFDGYYNEGGVNGGNIQIHLPKGYTEKEG